MAQDSKNNPQAGQKDDPRQALEEGDPKMTGRSRGRPVEEQGEPDANRTHPDASQKQGKKDVTATTPHRESGDQ
jgi:hypothetical protein